MIELIELKTIAEAHELARERPELEEAGVLQFEDGIVLLVKKDNNNGGQA